MEKAGDIQGMFKAVPANPPTVPAIKLFVISCVLVCDISLFHDRFPRLSLDAGRQEEDIP